jgi:predicted dehydrogenase
MGFGDIEDIFVCDPKIHQPKHPHYMEYRKIPVTPEDDVFIATPVKWHYSVAQYFLAKGVNVFCEKPLCYNLMDAKTLYGYAKDSHLFVDWTFVYNIQVKAIKHVLDSGVLGKIKTIHMNRLNLGPARTDVDAKEDLASHDVSILRYWYEQVPAAVQWHMFGIGAEARFPSVLGMLKYANGSDPFTVTIHASWEHPVKERACIIVGEEGVLVWDDIKQTIHVDGEELKLEDKTFDTQREPLRNSITAFLSHDNKVYEFNKNLTLKIMHTLEKNGH